MIFLKTGALASQNQGLSQTTCIMLDDRIIGYYTLCCDGLGFKRGTRLALFNKNKQFKTYPAIKLARMGIQKEHRLKGIGSIVIGIVRGMVWVLNKNGIGCKFITVDAYSNAAFFYLKNGFEFNREADQKRVEEAIKNDKIIEVSMRLNIFK